MVTVRAGRSCGLGLATALLTLLCCAGVSRAATSLTLKLTRPVGYLNAVVGGGTPGEQVALSEDGKPLGTVTLGSHGATARHVVTWACSPLKRTLVATPSDGSAPVSATVTTPSCEHRLAVGFPTGATVGAPAQVALHDRWNLGDVALSVCETAPGGPTSCANHSLTAARGDVPVTLPRVGGWELTVSMTDGIHHHQLVWAEHPGGQITLLAAGDSEMQVLDSDLTTDLAPYGVHVVSDAKESTGLTTPVLNWQAEAGHDVRVAHPDVSVISMGANDGFPIGAAPCCGAPWAAGYGGLVAHMARTLLQGQSGRVYWFVLAAPKPPQFQSVINGVNAGIEQAAKALAGRMGLINANAYFTPGDHYRDTMTVGGHTFTIHESDGIHLDATADVYAAQLVVGQLLADRVIRPR